MKGHCFGLKCMNSCCYYARLFVFAGARRFVCKAYSLVQYINICKVARKACQKPQRAIELKGHHRFVFSLSLTCEKRCCVLIPVKVKDYENIIIQDYRTENKMVYVGIGSPGILVTMLFMLNQEQ